MIPKALYVVVSGRSNPHANSEVEIFTRRRAAERACKWGGSAAHDVRAADEGAREARRRRVTAMENERPCVHPHDSVHTISIGGGDTPVAYWCRDCGAFRSRAWREWETPGRGFGRARTDATPPEAKPSGTR